MQYGYMPSRGMTDAIFILDQMQEKNRAMQQDIFLVFLDLENAFNGITMKFYGGPWESFLCWSTQI